MEQEDENTRPCFLRLSLSGYQINNQCKEVCTKFLLEQRLKKAPSLPGACSRASSRVKRDYISTWTVMFTLLSRTCAILHYVSLVYIDKIISWFF